MLTHELCARKTHIRACERQAAASAAATASPRIVTKINGMNFMIRQTAYKINNRSLRLMTIVTRENYFRVACVFFVVAAGVCVCSAYWRMNLKFR